jgi:hypothetical protein
MAQKNKIIEEMEINKISSLLNVESESALVDSLKDSETTGLYRFCGFAISDYAMVAEPTNIELMKTQIVTGIISSDDNFSDEELGKLGDELEKLYPEIVVFDYWYHHQEKNDDLSDENIEKVRDILSKRLALHDLDSYGNRLAYCRTRDRLMLVEVYWNYGGETCAMYARNARHAYNIFKEYPNQISDLLPCDEMEALKNLTWEVKEEADEMHLEAVSSELLRHRVNITISPLEIPEGRLGYSLGYYAE